MRHVLLLCALLLTTAVGAQAKKIETAEDLILASKFQVK